MSIFLGEKNEMMEKSECNLKFKARKTCQALSLPRRNEYVCNLYLQIFACPNIRIMPGWGVLTRLQFARTCEYPSTHYNFIKMSGPALVQNVAHSAEFSPSGKKDSLAYMYMCELNRIAGLLRESVRVCVSRRQLQLNAIIKFLLMTRAFGCDKVNGNPAEWPVGQLAWKYAKWQGESKIRR